MTFDTTINIDAFLETAWTGHADRPQEVADRVAGSLELVRAPEHVPPFVRLLVHVYGEHLGLWQRGVELLESSRQLPVVDDSASAVNAIVRGIASLRYADGSPGDLRGLSAEDQVCALATASSALAARGDVPRAIGAFSVKPRFHPDHREVEMIEGSCHCGAVHWTFEGQPDGATACNCTVCRRYGVLWAYDYDGEGIKVTGKTQPYIRGKAIEFHFCPVCGCVSFWRARETNKEGRRRIAVNLRLAEPGAVGAIPIDHFDGLGTFDDLPRDGRCVADYWF